ncbi:hypothetical protein D3C86_1637630 [compost metagenome]
MLRPRQAMPRWASPMATTGLSEVTAPTRSSIPSPVNRKWSFRRATLVPARYCAVAPAIWPVVSRRIPMRCTTSAAGATTSCRGAYSTQPRPVPRQTAWLPVPAHCSRAVRVTSWSGYYLTWASLPLSTARHNRPGPRNSAPCSISVWSANWRRSTLKSSP